MPDREWLGPWCSGWQHCTRCGNRHVAVWPACAEVCECPECGEMACLPDEPLDPAHEGRLEGTAAFPITDTTSLSWN